MPTRIAWSGLTGRTGREAMAQISKVSDVEIVIGMKREVTGADDFNLRGETFEGVKWRQYGQICCDRLDYLGIESGVDAIVDFSHPAVFDEVLRVAIRTGKPLISGTSGLSNRQMATLYDATSRIPIFRGGNFRFKVKKFIDEAVKLATQEEGLLYLQENFYTGKKLPSETAKVLEKKIMDTTGKIVRVNSADAYGPDLICNWEFEVCEQVPFNEGFRRTICYRTVGFGELAHDVLEIAKVMAKKPVKKGELYDLDEIWNDLPH